jgi:hypothetical protein
MHFYFSLQYFITQGTQLPKSFDPCMGFADALKARPNPRVAADGLKRLRCFLLDLFGRYLLRRSLGRITDRFQGKEDRRDQRQFCSCRSQSFHFSNSPFHGFSSKLTSVTFYRYQRMRFDSMGTRAASKAGMMRGV